MYTLKKSLGQHFLKDETIILDIVDALKKDHFSNLLEVGPGAGALTKHLMKLPGVDFKAVELDDEKVAYLEKTYPALKDNIIHKSFLDIEQPFKESFVVIGNFPYNISTQILFKILDWKDDVPVIIGMFQKEVAERAAAKPGSKVYGVLSALIQPFYHIEYLFDVPGTGGQVEFGEGVAGDQEAGAEVDRLGEHLRRVDAGDTSMSPWMLRLRVRMGRQVLDVGHRQQVDVGVERGVLPHAGVEGGVRGEEAVALALPQADRGGARERGDDVEAAALVEVEQAGLRVDDLVEGDLRDRVVGLGVPEAGDHLDRVDREEVLELVAVEVGDQQVAGRGGGGQGRLRGEHGVLAEQQDEAAGGVQMNA